MVESLQRVFFRAAVVLGFLCQTTAQAQSGGIPLWTNRYHGPAIGNSPTAMTVDSSGNVFVTGASNNTNGHPDYATIKYSGAGVPLWTNRYNGPGDYNDQANAIAVDGSGNVFVAGYSAGDCCSTDYAIIKYSAAGLPLWTNRYNGVGYGSDTARAMAVDRSGNVFVTGSSQGTISGYDYVTIAYSGAGVPLWINRYNGPGNGSDRAAAVAVDGSGNVVVTGYVTGTNLYYEYATIKYSAAGVPLCTNLYNGPGGSSGASAVAVDGSGNVFVTGGSWDIGGDNDYATIKYSGAGVPLWTNRYKGPNYNDLANAIAVDGSGNVFVTGYSDSRGTAFDYATIKYSGDGVPLWTNRYDGNSDDYAYAIAVDRSGNVFVTGHSYRASSRDDYVTVAYSGAGVPLWTNRYDGNVGDDDAIAVAVDSNGNVFVTGFSAGTNGYSDYTTIKYSSVIPPSLTVARTPTNTVAVSWPSPSTGFTLQQNTNGIATANWSNVVTTPLDDGTTKTVIVNPPAGNRFYRLKQGQ